MTIIFLRTLLLYTVVIGAVRLMGKRQLGELQPAELVTTILISNIATLSLEDAETPLLQGILPITVLVCCEVLVSWVTLRSAKLRRLVSGSPKIVISNGQIDQCMLRDLRLSLDDLMTALRTSGVFSPDEVQYAVVETNGSVSVLERADCRPAQRGDVGVHVPDGDPPQLVIADGELREDALAAIGTARPQIEALLRQRGLALRDVFLLMADRAGHLHIVLREGGAA